MLTFFYQPLDQFTSQSEHLLCHNFDSMCKFTRDYIFQLVCFLWYRSVTLVSRIGWKIKFSNMWHYFEQIVSHKQTKFIDVFPTHKRLSAPLPPAKKNKNFPHSCLFSLFISVYVAKIMSLEIPRNFHLVIFFYESDTELT